VEKLPPPKVFAKLPHSIPWGSRVVSTGVRGVSAEDGPGHFVREQEAGAQRVPWGHLLGSRLHLCWGSLAVGADGILPPCR